VLSYDGSRWSSIPVYAPAAYDAGARRSTQTRHRAGVFSIGRLPSQHPDAGRILVGGDGTFGVLEKDSLHVMSYQSLLPLLSASAREEVGTVTHVQATRNAAYFLTRRALYRWTGESVSVWSINDVPRRSALSPQPGASASGDRRGSEDAGAFSTLFAVQDTLYVHVAGVGLLYADGPTLRRISPNRPFADRDVRVVLGNDRSDSGSLLIGTARGAFFEMSRDGGVEALDWEVQSWLARFELAHGTRLPDGTLALATRQGGVARVTATGDRLHVLDTRIGLPSNVANHVFLDRGAGLWISLGDGLARVDALAPFTYFDEPLGLSTGVSALARHDGVLYACSRSGLHRLGTAQGTFARMASVPDLRTPCTSLASTSGGLLVATRRGVAVYNPGTPVYFANPDTNTETGSTLLHLMPNTAFVTGAQGGIKRLRFENDRWRISSSSLSSPELDTTFVQDVAWQSTGTLWATAADHVLRVENAMSDIPTVTRFDAADGLSASPDMRVFVIADTVYVSTKNGLHRHTNAADTSGSFVPDTTFDPDWAQDGSEVTHLIEVENGGVWGRAIESSSSGQRVVTSMYQGPQGRLHNSRPLVPFRDEVRGPFYVEGQVVWVGDRGVSPLGCLSCLYRTGCAIGGPYTGRSSPHPSRLSWRSTVHGLWRGALGDNDPGA
jgi:hypothetical protein